MATKSNSKTKKTQETASVNSSVISFVIGVLLVYGSYKCTSSPRTIEDTKKDNVKANCKVLYQAVSEGFKYGRENTIMDNQVVKAERYEVTDGLVPECKIYVKNVSDFPITGLSGYFKCKQDSGVTSYENVFTHDRMEPQEIVQLHFYILEMNKIKLDSCSVVTDNKSDKGFGYSFN